MKQLLQILTIIAAAVLIAAPENFTVLTEPAPAQTSPGIQGVWHAESVEGGGVSGSEGLALVALDKTLTILVGGKTVVKAAYTLDAKQTPPTVDLESDGQRMLGIWRRNANALEVCLGREKARPANFAGTKSALYMTLSRLSHPHWEAIGRLLMAGAEMNYETSDGRDVLGPSDTLVAVLAPPGTFKDDDCAWLQPLATLKFVRLGGTEVTAAGLRRLAGLKNLRRLDLDVTRLDDNALVHLKGLTRLEWLNLSARRITDAGLAHLAPLAKLEHLSLGGTQTTDVGLESLRGLAHLKWLNLTNTKITDRGLRHLKRLTDLEVLQLSYTRVTDTGLEELKGLANLEHLFLTQTKVSTAGIKRLQAALPNCTIEN